MDNKTHRPQNLASDPIRQRRLGSHWPTSRITWIWSCTQAEGRLKASDNETERPTAATRNIGSHLQDLAQLRTNANKSTISLPVMALRAQFEGHNDIGVFTRLTNTYCLVSIGGSEGYYSVFEAELGDSIPVIHASIAGIRTVGCLTAGESY
ncbi:unnamed protein product [Dibothriocephalus latus]|uniref:Uncharacterized protein n=1 Tax=Dibothriocephalus latus TaxID=60516 RepID=A0A3P7LZ41_DIBLA|nr:unnamed protein product [Dibothriocephalus latus]